MGELKGGSVKRASATAHAGNFYYCQRVAENARLKLKGEKGGHPERGEVS